MVMNVQSPVDEYGNLTFNRDEGLYVVMTSKDGAGAYINMVTYPHFFQIDNGRGVRKAIVAVAGVTNKFCVTLSPLELTCVLTGSVSRFTVTDESNAVPVVVWEGTIRERSPL